jgi:hypothetical protein
VMWELPSRRRRRRNDFVSRLIEKCEIGLNSVGTVRMLFAVAAASVDGMFCSRWIESESDKDFHRSILRSKIL